MDNLPVLVNLITTHQTRNWLYCKHYQLTADSRQTEIEWLTEQRMTDWLTDWLTDSDRIRERICLYWMVTIILNWLCLTVNQLLNSYRADVSIPIHANAYTSAASCAVKHRNIPILEQLSAYWTEVYEVEMRQKANPRGVWYSSCNEYV